MPCPDLVRVLVPELIPLLTGYTQAAFAALVHMLDAWNVADDANRPHTVIGAAALLDSLQSPASQPLAWFVVLNRLSLYGARQLVTDLECYEISVRHSSKRGDEATPFRLMHPPGYWRAQFMQAVADAPLQLGVWLCCGRRINRHDGSPSLHLGTEACTELAERRIK